MIDSTFVQVKIPNASNACSGFDEFGWTFFDLNIIHDEHKDDPVTVLQADFVSFTFFFIIQTNKNFLKNLSEMKVYHFFLVSKYLVCSIIPTNCCR